MSFKNLQKHTNHLLTINKRNTGSFTLMVQSTNVPAITANEATAGAPKRAGFSIIGTALGFGDLTCKVLLDENMDSYFEIYRWIKELVEPEKHNPVKFNDSVSEASLFLLTNNKTDDTKFIIDFHKIWPISLSEINFDAATTDDAPITFDVTFKYRTLTIKRDGISY